jgi:putative transposase
MANTYTSIHLHVVFAVKSRYGLILPSWKDELYKYITGIVQNKGHKMIIINGMPDHVHILIGFRPTGALSDLVKDVKAGSSKWINESAFVKGRFEWPKGFGAFSHSQHDLPSIINYIENQETHHRIKTFSGEYQSLLKDFGISFDRRYIFKEVGE